MKRQLLAPKKIYFIDTAMAQTVGFRFSADGGRILENIVYLEFLRDQEDVFYHAAKQACDFILRRQGRIAAAYQVTLSLQDAEIRQRKIAGLVEAMSTYQLETGTILTDDEEEEIVVNAKTGTCKIQVVPVWKWLLLKAS